MTYNKEQCQHPINTYWHDVCLMQGVSASFYKDQLTDLVFRLPIGTPLEVCRAFTQKYGKPDHEDKAKEVCTWWLNDSDGKLVQSLMINAVHAKIGGQAADSVYIQLSNTVPSKDI